MSMCDVLDYLGAFLPIELGILLLVIIPRKKIRLTLAWWSIISIAIIICFLYLPFYFDLCIWLIDIPFIEGTIYIYQFPCFAFIWVIFIIVCLELCKISRNTRINILFKVISLIFCIHFIYIIHEIHDHFYPMLPD